MRTNRYRRDQRQLDEEEEMWFNEDEDFDEGEAVVPAPNSNLINNKKLNNELEAIGKKRTTLPSVSRFSSRMVLTRRLLL